MAAYGTRLTLTVVALTAGLTAPGCGSNGEDHEDTPEPPLVGIYDWKANVVAPNGRPGSGDPGKDGGTRSLYEAVRRASQVRPRAEQADRLAGGAQLPLRKADRANDAWPAQFYVFDADRELIAGPEPERPRDTPAGAEVLKVRRGIVVLAGFRPIEATPDVPESYFVLEDDAALSSEHIADAEQNFHPRTQGPVVVLRFTAEGRERLARVTRRSARQGGRQSAAPRAARQPRSRRFAIAVDRQGASPPRALFIEFPNGVGTRAGAMINGVGSIQDTQELAKSLSSKP